MGPNAGNRNRPAYSGQARYVMPENIRKLFQPRPAPPFKPIPTKKKLKAISGIASFLPSIWNSLNQDEPGKPSMLQHPVESNPTSGQNNAVEQFEFPAQRRRRQQKERIKRLEDIVEKYRVEYKKTIEHHKVGTRNVGDLDKEEELEAKIKARWTSDGRTTMFLGNLAPETSELTIRREMQAFGNVVDVIRPVKKVRDSVLSSASEVPRIDSGDQEDEFIEVPCKYAFVEFEREADMLDAVKKVDGKKIDGRRVIADKERSRVVPGWLPPRLDSPKDRKIQGKNVVRVFASKPKAFDRKIGVFGSKNDYGARDADGQRDSRRDWPPDDQQRDRDRERDWQRDRDRVSRDQPRPRESFRDDPNSRKRRFR